MQAPSVGQVSNLSPQPLPVGQVSNLSQETLPVGQVCNLSKKLSKETIPGRQGCNLSLNLLILALSTLLFTLPTSAPAQSGDDDYDDLPLIERDYFDRITLDKRNHDTVYDVQRLELPGGKAPKDPTSLQGELFFRRIDAPSLLFAVPWKRVVKVETFADLILAEAIRMRDGGQLDTSFEFFSFLFINYPDTEGLQREVDTYLYLDLVQLFKAKRYHETLSVLEELYARNPKFQPPFNATPLEQALAKTLDEMLKGYFQQEDYASVRGLLARIEKSYGAKQQKTIDKWQGELLRKATESRDATRKFLADGEGRNAHRTVRRMLGILPTISGGRELQAEVMNKFPLVMVGVDQQAFQQDPTRIDNWAAKRAGHLTHRTLMEYQSRGEEGGHYVSPLGTFEMSEDGSEFLLDMSRIEARTDAPQVTGYEVSQRLISLADPGYHQFQPPWFRLVQNVRLENVNRVGVDLRFPHVLPEAFLRIPIEPPSPGEGPAQDGVYTGGQPANNEVTYVRNSRYAERDESQHPKIVEAYFADANAAVIALKKGEIDVIDRVFPADIRRLQDDPEIEVRPYELPTVHLLIPNPRTPYMENVNFRKALIYGINRQVILSNVLLANRTVQGCRVISGPFPAGISDSDPFAYAYNERILPLPYEATLAVARTSAAEAELTKAAEKEGAKPPARPKLTIAYPVGHVPRIACEEIVRHLQVVFQAIDKANPITVEAVQLPDGVTTDVEGKYDLLYVELSMWEPLVEARRLFKSDNLIRLTTPYIDLALYELSAARNWSQARRKLYELHSLTHAEAAVIPLYQIRDHVAFRSGLSGIDDAPLTLYHNARNWRISPARAVSGNE